MSGGKVGRSCSVSEQGSQVNDDWKQDGSIRTIKGRDGKSEENYMAIASGLAPCSSSSLTN